MTHRNVVGIHDEGLGNSSWLIDLGDGSALVVDPARDPSPYLAAAERLGVVVRFAAETHLHADFVTGSRELAAHGAAVLASAAGGLQWPHRPLADGEETDLGGLRLRALATPGHTPEHLAYLLLDGDRPAAVFTGGALLVGAIARTDLIAPDQTEPLARALWRALHERLLTLPDEVAVYPTHGAGSFCSAPAGDERSTTIGAQRRTNPLLAAPDEDTFVTRLLGSLGSYPPYFLRLREVNRRGPAVHGTLPPLAALGLDGARRALDAGAELVDVRPVVDFAAGHVPGSLSIALRPQFASWLGWLVPTDRPLVFILGPEQDRAEIVRQCLGIGHEQLVGELAGGVDTWAGAGLPLERTPTVTAQQLGAAAVVDVRQDAEWAAGHLPAAQHVELGRLRDTDVPPVRPLAVMCGHGERAATGASLLLRAGRGDVTVVTGGPGDWAAATGRRLEPGA